LGHGRQAAEAGGGSGAAVEVEPAVFLVIVEFADARRAQELFHRPGDDDGMFARVLFEELLAFRKLIHGNRWIEMVGGVIHDVMKHPVDEGGHCDVRRAAKLDVVEVPFVEVVVPSRARMGVLLIRGHAHEVSPDGPGNDDRRGTGEPMRKKVAARKSDEPVAGHELKSNEAENQKAVAALGENPRRAASAIRPEQILAVELDDVANADAERRAIEALDGLSPAGKGVEILLAKRAEVGVLPFEAGKAVVQGVVRVDPGGKWVPRGEHGDAAENAIQPASADEGAMGRVVAGDEHRTDGDDIESPKDIDAEDLRRDVHENEGRDVGGQADSEQDESANVAGGAPLARQLSFPGLGGGDRGLRLGILDRRFRGRLRDGRRVHGRGPAAYWPRLSGPITMRSGVAASVIWGKGKIVSVSSATMAGAADRTGGSASGGGKVDPTGTAMTRLDAFGAELLRRQK